jgi:hypothetical protein
MSPATYPYKPAIRTLLPCVLFFGCGAYYLQHMASSNDRGLILDGILRFDVHGASQFYSFMAALSFVMAASALIGIFWSFVSDAELRITEVDLYLPQGFLHQEIRKIPFESIEQVQLLQRKKHRFLEIYSDGKKARINQTWLPNGAFAKIFTILEERLKADGMAQTDRQQIDQEIRKPPSQTVLSQRKTFGRRQ